MVLDPGAMRDRIEIQRASYSTSGGITTESWHLYRLLWSRASFQSGREFLAAGAVQNSAAAVFSIRFREDLKLSDRVKHKGKLWAIVGIVPIGHRQGIDLHCTLVGDA